MSVSVTSNRLAILKGGGGVGETSTGFVQVLEMLESPRILLWHFLGLEGPGKSLQVLESLGDL